MAPRQFLALVCVSLWSSVAVTGCRNPDSPLIVCKSCWQAAARNEDELIGQLKAAYQHRDYDSFGEALHPGYQSDFSRPDGTTSWGLTQELRIHRRMFRPEDVRPDEHPVPPDLYLASVDITLTARDSFRDATAYYFDPVTNPGGFHRESFTVTQAVYQASVFFQTQGETQYRADGAETFVVVNDLSKPVGASGKFLLYRWQEWGNGKSSARQNTSWASVKMLYGD